MNSAYTRAEWHSGFLIVGYPVKKCFESFIRSIVAKHASQLRLNASEGKNERTSIGWVKKNETCCKASSSISPCQRHVYTSSKLPEARLVHHEGTYTTGNRLNSGNSKATQRYVHQAKHAHHINIMFMDATNGGGHAFATTQSSSQNIH